VLFAITVFALVAVGGLALMNQGTAVAQRSLEIGLVREQIDTQTDALRYMRDAYIADGSGGGKATTLWQKIVGKDHTVSEADDFDSISDGKDCALPSPGKAFALNVTTLGTDPIIQTPTPDVATYAKVRYDLPTPTAEGIWIQAVPGKPGIGQPGFYDFHVRACWHTPGQSAPITLGTIVRLYDPQA